MATVTLVQAARCAANGIHLMTAQPMNINLTALAGGAIQFPCTNALVTIQGARTVDIIYDAAHGSGHETIQVSSVIA
jgi:hypothetical protein